MPPRPEPIAAGPPPAPLYTGLVTRALALAVDALLINGIAETPGGHVMRFAVRDATTGAVR